MSIKPDSKLWNFVPLQSLALKGPQNGLYKPQEFYGTGYKMVHMQDLFSNLTISSSEMSRVKVTDKELINFGLNCGDILFARRSIAVEGSGQASIVGKIVEPVTFESSIIRISLDKDKVIPKFVLYFLQSPIGKHEMRCITRVVTISGITGEDLKKYKVPVPTIDEQIAMVEKLETWDRSINLTESLISAKQQRRIGLIQQLLTGKRRLPGFVKSNKSRKTPFGALPADWDYPRIGEVANEVSERNGTLTERTVLSCTKHQGLVDSLAYFGKQIFSEDLSNYKVVRNNHFAYATNHIDEGSIGYQDQYDDALISPIYTVFKTDGTIDDRFLFMVLKTETYRHIFASNTSASVDRRGSLRWTDFAKIHIPKPTIDEQKAIVKVINTADRELDLLRSQLDALKEQKKGLMQQLLTGKIRVKC